MGKKGKKPVQKKEKTVRTKKEKQKKGSFYSVTDEKLSRSKRFCPKCGPGVFMAEHKDRVTCGKCSFTEMKSKQ